MPKRIANVALTIHREGKRINVKPGDSVTLSKEEIDDFTKLNPVALRLPVNEGSAEDDNQNAPNNPNLTGGGKSGGTHQNNGEVDLDSLKVDELRQYAKDNQLDVDVNQNKEPLLAAVKAAVADKESL